MSISSVLLNFTFGQKRTYYGVLGVVFTNHCSTEKYEHIFSFTSDENTSFEKFLMISIILYYKLNV